MKCKRAGLAWHHLVGGADSGAEREFFLDGGFLEVAHGPNGGLLQEVRCVIKVNPIFGEFILKCDDLAVDLQLIIALVVMFLVFLIFLCCVDVPQTSDVGVGECGVARFSHNLV